MRNKLLYIAALMSISSLSLIVVPKAYCEPVVSLKQNFYKVDGITAREIRNSLNINSPVIIDGKQYDAYTRWHVSWEYQYIWARKRCTISEISTNLTVEQSLPRLVSILSPDLQYQWNNYHNALMQHENGHKKFGMQAAIEVEKNLIAIAPQRSCKKLESIVKESSRKIIRKYVNQEKEYDRLTDYGSREGARFP